MEATAKDLRFHVKELLDAVSRGEEVTITYRGEPCAKLVPYDPDEKREDSRQHSALFGLWANREDLDDVESYVRERRKTRY